MEWHEAPYRVPAVYRYASKKRFVEVVLKQHLEQLVHHNEQGVGGVYYFVRGLILWLEEVRREPLAIILLDGEKYGVGAIKTGWEVEHKPTTKQVLVEAKGRGWITPLGKHISALRDVTANFHPDNLPFPDRQTKSLVVVALSEEEFRGPEVLQGNLTEQQVRHLGEQGANPDYKWDSEVWFMFLVPY